MTKPQYHTLACPLCQNTAFEREQFRLQGRWLDAPKITMMICKSCRHILHFHGASPIFDLER